MLEKSKLKARLERCKKANEVIKAISEHGRRFFWEPRKKRLAFIEVDSLGRLWWHDEYTEEPQYLFLPAYKRWKNFSSGGTLRRLVEALKKYVTTGEQISPGHFGPWDDAFCGGDLWGYGFEEMEEVRKKVMATGVVRGN